MGYVHKGKVTRHIIEAIRSVLAGKIYLSDETSAMLLHRVVGAGGHKLATSPVENLADRELETFELLGQGLTTHQIAIKMHVKPKTVETYRARLKEKLNLNNATELIQRAVQWLGEQH